MDKLYRLDNYYRELYTSRWEDADPRNAEDIALYTRNFVNGWKDGQWIITRRAFIRDRVEVPEWLEV